MEDQSPAPILPKSYTWLRMIGIGLSVLSLGLAIAFIGYFMTQKQESPFALTPTPSITTSPTSLPTLTITRTP
ncbi:MAG TPA: hypothetical protein VF820_06425 [Patescibacteria group bacterium]